MSSRTTDALNALTHVMVEHKGVLTVLQQRHTEVVYQRALNAMLAAVEELEAAWAENERKGGS